MSGQLAVCLTDRNLYSIFENRGYAPALRFDSGDCADSPGSSARRGIRRGAVDGLRERRWLSISPNASPIEAFRLAAKRTADSMLSRIRPCSSIALTHYKVRTAGSGIRGSGDGIYERSPARHRSFGKRCRFGARGSHQVKDARAFMEQIIGYDSPVAAPPDRF